MEGEQALKQGKKDYLVVILNPIVSIVLFLVFATAAMVSSISYVRVCLNVSTPEGLYLKRV